MNPVIFTLIILPLLFSIMMWFLYAIAIMMNDKDGEHYFKKYARNGFGVFIVGLSTYIYLSFLNF